MLKSNSFIFGIDEAGRGPLAGPVAVGVVKIKSNFSKDFFKGIKDSKQLNRSERELWYSLAKEAKKKGDLDFTVSLVSQKVIDRHGISYAIALGIKRALKRLEANISEAIFLDGSLKAPKEFSHQTTIIKGDEKMPIISLASICAKVRRDSLLRRWGKLYPDFGFEIHKGYGTKAHIEILKKMGPTPLHRLSFISSLTRK